MKKLVTMLAGFALALSLVGCSEDAPSATTTTTGAAGDTIYVLGPTPDHGWTAQAGTYADAKVKEINAAGKYKAQYFASSSAEDQNDVVQTIIANKDAAGVVFFALDDPAKSGQEALIAANIPFISFDRIIEGPDKSAILNFSGDNWTVGTGIAYWLQTKGLEPGDVLVTLIGDTGTVSSRRQEGFEQFLLGTRDYQDGATGQTYHTSRVWTQAEIDALTAAYKVDCNWSADNASQFLELQFPDIIAAGQAAGGDVYFFSMDDEMTFGVLNVLEGNNLTAEQKADLEALNVYITAVGGMQELFDVIAGTAPLSPVSAQYFDDIMSMWFSPVMMQTAIDYMIQYLDKDNWTFAVGSGQYEPTWIVDKTNVSKFEGFTGH
ncbi:MAG: substrate-binding domain-containing protein [Propionibacteriaceae bacterium]|jgi:ribose transport system substrate-binding protein|nr:substrate-binding domain-containing protein [Propionibacteriaceae bacterium]